MDNLKRPAFVFYIVNIVCCFLLLIPAFYNGYGIVNSDFGTYLPSGFKPDMPVDRPITYGILLRIFSLNGLSLWLVLFAQAFFVSNLITRLCKNILQYKNWPAFSLVIVALLSLLTGLSWTVSQLQPDIYTPIAIMCAIILLIANENKSTTVLTYILFFFAIATHASHMVLFVLLLLSIIIFYKRSLFRERRKRILWLVALSILPTFTMLPIFAKSKHIFGMASLLEKGVLKKYLDEHCSTNQYKLCAYKDSLLKSGDDFMWESYSPVYKEGGWKAVKPEYDAIISGAFSDPGCLLLFAKRSVQFSIKQLSTFEIGPGNIPFGQGTYVYDNLALYIPGELDAFNSSKQNRNELLDKLELPNKVFSYVALLSVIGLAMFLVIRFRRPDRLMDIFLFIVSASYVINAWDCATFSVINGRYGCKLIWMLPFALCLVMFRLLKVRKEA